MYERRRAASAKGGGGGGGVEGEVETKKAQHRKPSKLNNENLRPEIILNSFNNIISLRETYAVITRRNARVN